jgi:hypothetical protein
MKRNVFISYNYQDIAVANLIRHELHAYELEPWIDVAEILPGEPIADKITEGLSASDYYLILISENSNASPWVKRELSLAFELSDKKKLSIVPILLADVSIPLELQGLLFIDFRMSIKDGLAELSKFFKSQFTKISALDQHVVRRMGESDSEIRRRSCEDYLRELELSELRYVLSEKLSREHIQVIWFDLFGRRLSDEIHVGDVTMCCVELLDRARREDVLLDLVSIVCRNHPHIRLV